MTVQLNKLDTSTFPFKKNKTKVVFEDVLDIAQYTAKTSTSTMYDLYAVIVHKGHTCTSGHYTCYVKAANGKWFNMNDSFVSEVSFSKVRKDEAYVLFYSKKSDTRRPPETDERKTDQDPKKDKKRTNLFDRLKTNKEKKREKSNHHKDERPSQMDVFKKRMSQVKGKVSNYIKQKLPKCFQNCTKKL